MAKYTVDDVKKAASKNNIQCISTEYSSYGMNFICEKCGHEWQTRPNRIIYGANCPICIRKKPRSNHRYTLKEIQGAVSKKDIECLSKEYNSYSMDFKCNTCGHRWSTEGKNFIIKDCGCPECYRRSRGDYRREFDVEYIKDYAKKRNMEFLSEEYKNTSTSYEWHCLKCDNVWEANFNSIKNNNSGCPVCAQKKNKEDRRKNSPYNTEVIGKMAEENNVELLSEYKNAHTKMKFRCKIHDNIFYKKWNKIQQNSHWCPECAQEEANDKIGNSNRKYKMKYFHNHAERMGGKCHSSGKYHNNTQYLEFSCKLGHRFEVRASSIIEGYWC